MRPTLHALTRSSLAALLLSLVACGSDPTTHEDPSTDAGTITGLTQFTPLP